MKTHLDYLEEDMEMMKLLGNPTRFRILCELYPNNTYNVSEILRSLDLPQAYTSQQLSKMRGNIVDSERRGNEVYYFIKNPKAKAIMEILLNYKN
ncbi:MULTISPECIES: ArsR/SmtB family transcription factor [Bacillus]|uniref:Transcriptional repressor pagR n=1 Tax=Bacillus mycoides TaxID=1405 RepID=A0A1G4EUH0_BACMY|nr:MULTISPECIES: metalloregulator ArsR/SmtB family transcription factor [Bacillus cereus group]MBJ8096349.1 winged helix-turn-helix transcriptional regulator [Bacillus cereus]MCQ6360460.1 metalloregulator ArsR/SmtB family transcription factor [Bacillus cereus]QWH20773.1 ArsR family transcriptional regulator [Bacillus mycoides]CAH2462973.1 DNA-binding transcription factor activity [Bacillus mycoides KBAB4]SCB71604.1 Transcriptional repressor pagR [Bacillus mycoides]